MKPNDFGRNERRLRLGAAGRTLNGAMFVSKAHLDSVLRTFGRTTPPERNQAPAQLSSNQRCCSPILSPSMGTSVVNRLLR